MDITAFRTAFPEFSNTAKYSDAIISPIATVGELLLNETRWGDLYTYGLQLYVAHKLALKAEDIATAAKGKTPGMQSGILSNKGVGGVSAGYDTHAVTLEGAANYNLTAYGREFWQLANIVGVGGYYCDGLES